MNNSINIVYETLFSAFMSEIIPLKEIDKMLNETIGHENNESDIILDLKNTISDLSDDYNEKQALENDKNYEIGIMMPGLNNFRLISRAHTDRLSEADTSVIENLINDINEDNMKSACEVVERTYEKVMCVDCEDSDNMTCLGPYQSPEFCFDNDAIVIGLVMIYNDDVNDVVMEKIATVAENMKTQMFRDISKSLERKIELYVSLD